MEATLALEVDSGSSSWESSSVSASPSDSTYFEAAATAEARFEGRSLKGTGSFAATASRPRFFSSTFWSVSPLSSPRPVTTVDLLSAFRGLSLLFSFPALVLATAFERLTALRDVVFSSAKSSSLSVSPSATAGFARVAAGFFCGPFSATKSSSLSVAEAANDAEAPSNQHVSGAFFPRQQIRKGKKDSFPSPKRRGSDEASIQTTLNKRYARETGKIEKKNHFHARKRQSSKPPQTQWTQQQPSFSSLSFGQIRFSLDQNLFQM